MINIPIDKNRLIPAKDAHFKAIKKYVTSKDEKYQKAMFENIAKILKISDSFEDLKGLNNWDWLRNFILASPKELGEFVINSDLLQFDEFRKMYINRFCAGDSVYLDNDNNYNAYSFCENLDVRVCPYCDEEYLDILDKSGDKKKRFLELDHFYPKSTYPALAMCFYNLIPSGHNCNSIKLVKLLGMNPYEENIEYCTHLYPDLKIGVNIETLTEDDCVIKFHPAKGMKENVDVLMLEERYLKHKGKAHKYIRNKQRFPDEKIEEMVRGGYAESKEAAYRDLFDIPLPTDKSPALLTKLRKDIVGK